MPKSVLPEIQARPARLILAGNIKSGVEGGAYSNQAGVLEALVQQGLRANPAVLVPQRQPRPFHPGPLAGPRATIRLCSGDAGILSMNVAWRKTPAA
jgi:hypothetical protein